MAITSHSHGDVGLRTTALGHAAHRRPGMKTSSLLFAAHLMKIKVLSSVQQGTLCVLVYVCVCPHTCVYKCMCVCKHM